MSSNLGDTHCVFVLRGRPGLGHVMPGFALAVAAARRGCRSLIMTYSNGCAYLERSRLPSLLQLQPLMCRTGYVDWPGLDIYDDGLRQIAPVVARLNPRWVFFGGEYLLASLGEIFRCKTVMLFNPEIFEQNERNATASPLFARLFADVDYLCPLSPLQAECHYLREFDPLRPKLTPPGPFLFQPDSGAAGGKRRSTVRVLIANGGGVAFPSSTASYSSSAASPARWLEQTRAMTRTSIQSVLEAGTETQVDVFSCLSEDDNSALARAFVDETRVAIHPVSLEFYDRLCEADLVISRAGSGFLGDVALTKARIVVWPLEQHDEQLRNARALQQQRAGVRVVLDGQELREAIAEELAGLARRAPCNRPRPGADTATILANADRLLSDLKVACDD